jgi:hypothetical protein
MTKLTSARRKALEILRDHPGIRPRGFAEKMWPDSEGWSHSTKCGPHGVTRGGGMPQAAGSYLGKLRKDGLVRLDLSQFNNDYYLTEKGKHALGGP